MTQNTNIFRMEVKTVMRWDGENKIFRLFRICGPQWKVSFALQPSVFSVRREWRAIIINFCGIRLHFKRICGGRFI